MKSYLFDTPHGTYSSLILEKNTTRAYHWFNSQCGYHLSNQSKKSRARLAAWIYAINYMDEKTNIKYVNVFAPCRDVLYMAPDKVEAELVLHELGRES